ncbi:hypothetical protein [Alkaliphilus sp. B6464]|uniref:hypothetical protein n=1 Tax=Alkaliphilus sp. B6464 TaxID=2731219 RepID=UPI001BA8E4A2|nr:hypothetical protein [Alkaliphilus sp. B6464]QUH22047.1 hypothetical protein HYG84_19265 [Alkaliphilus sp. B6464]
MGVSSTGILNKNKYSAKDVIRVVKKLPQIKEIIEIDSRNDTYYVVYANIEGCKYTRQLYIFTDIHDHDNIMDNNITLSLGCDEIAIKLIRDILSYFGGYIRESDGWGKYDIWDYVSKKDTSQLSEDEILEDKLLARLNDSEIHLLEKLKIVKYIRDNLDFIKSL